MSVRFGIIGCGTIALMYAEAINKTEEASIAGAYDLHAGIANQYCKNFGGNPYSDFEEIINAKDIDAVCILTPSGLHAKQAIQAINAGKHVLIEKPMALTIEQADSIIEAADKFKVKVGTISQYRFTDSFIKLKEAVDKKILGRIVTADVCMKYYRTKEYYAQSQWRGTWKMDGGGALMNQGIHGVDTLLSVAGPVKTVYGLARTLHHNIEVEDTALAALEFESGALGFIQGTTSVYPGYPRRLSVSGTKGTITICEELIVDWSIEGMDKPDDVVLGGFQKTGARDPKAIDMYGHLYQIRDMVDSIENNHEPAVNCREARNAIRLINTIYESSRTGRPIDMTHT